MLFWKRLTSHFKNCRNNSRQRWIQNRMTKKLQLDNGQQQSLTVVIKNMEEGKNRIHESFVTKDMLGFLDDEKLHRNKNKAELLTAVQQELDKNIDLIADFYDGLQDNQKDKFRQMLSSRCRYRACCG